ncbi:restriction endonuclease subunit S [Mycolicibacterium phocaicum]|uniref:Restriction endonuclease subunit S n=2 Tax=Mycolicibacterium phocaicum TaxID=319706 RepID=A0AA94UFG1_9MYCO|nr:restriction endonuclease subunit S [Mycolicibacterium phocaicum]
MRKYLRAANVGWSGLLLDDVKQMNFTDVELKTFRLEPGDLLLNEASGSPKEVGKPALWNGEIEDCAFQNTLLRVRPSNAAEPRYLLHYFGHEAATGAFARGSRGVGIHHLGREALSKWSIPLPPLDEQRRIAAILDQADSVRAKMRDRLGLLRTLAGAVYAATFGDPFENERQWPTKRVDEISRVQLGRQRSPKYQTGRYTHPYLRVANVYEDRLDLSDVLTMDFDEKDFADYRLIPGDILLNEGQSTELVGRPAIYRGEIADCCFQNTLLRVQVDAKEVLPEFALGTFLSYFRKGRFARLSSKTSSVAHLGKSRLASMRFPIPPMSLQLAYRDGLRALGAFDVSSAEVRCDELFASLQSRAFRGEL